MMIAIDGVGAGVIISNTYTALLHIRIHTYNLDFLRTFNPLKNSSDRFNFSLSCLSLINDRNNTNTIRRMQPIKTMKANTREGILYLWEVLNKYISLIDEISANWLISSIDLI